jgi:hypothetical protein
MKIVRMRGLHIYANPTGVRDESLIFYSRRADGPYYRWYYEAESSQWCCARVHLPELTLRLLSITAWQSVPATLRARLNEHYLE